MAAQQLLKQQELRVQILGLRRFIHDSNASERLVAFREAPLCAEHFHDARLEGFGVRYAGVQMLDERAATALCPCQQGVDERSAGVRVDLDETDVSLAHVEVIAEENTCSTLRSMACDGGRLAQSLFDRMKPIDVDTHITEPPDVWTARVSKKWGDQVPHIKRIDGRDLWLVGESPEGVPLLLVVVPVAGSTAVLRYFRTLGAGPAHSNARYLGTAVLVEELDSTVGLGGHRVVDQLLCVGLPPTADAMLLASGDHLHRWLGGSAHLSPLGLSPGTSTPPHHA